MNAAVALLVDAAVARVTVRLVDGRAKVVGQPAPALLELLRGHKPEIIEILRGDRCRRCGDRLGWPRLGAGLIFADNSAECMRCVGYGSAGHHGPRSLGPSWRA